MTREELIKQIEDLELEDDIHSAIIDLIDKSRQIDQKLLNAIADVLDLQADFYEKQSMLFEEEAKIYEDVERENDAIDKEEYQFRIEAIRKSQKEFFETIQTEAEKIMAQETKTKDETESLTKAREVIQDAHAQTVNPSIVLGAAAEVLPAPVSPASTNAAPVPPMPPNPAV